MALRSSIDRVLAAYPIAITEKFAEHPLARFLRKDFPDVVAKVTGNTDRLVYRGSAGQGIWARGPWVAIFDPLITSTPQSGYYLVYLFREDMQGVYLSLNQGMTEAKRQYKSDAKTALLARAGNYRAMLGTQVHKFRHVKIDLAPSSPSNDTAFYEAGNICAKYYPADDLPSEAQLTVDLTDMLALYESLLEVETIGDSFGNQSEDEPVTVHIEDATKFRLHKRIERNSKLVQEVKKIQGCICQVCQVNFEERYGEIGKGYIEAHHLKPLATLKGTKISMDPRIDFAVLCANCHRMVHRSGTVDDIDTFKAIHFRG
jgi:5-methylcytosine-specific restriction protein A